MPIADSIYTNPDALRAKYRNPKSPLGNADEAASTGSGAANDTAANALGSIQQGQPVTGAGGNIKAGYDLPRDTERIRDNTDSF